jgi:flagellar hook-length control protein FliK
VAHAARQQLADAPEGTEAAPFGALVSALAQTSEIPAEGAQAASAVATITAEGKPAEAAAAPLQPIDLNFLSQLRQPKAEALPTSFAAENAGGPGQAGARAAADGPATPVHVVPIEIGLRALAGGRKFDIRLDPAELGRVDVNLEISDAGEVTAKLVVDRVETLQLLQRDARTLERAFEQAGLKPSDGGVDITLRDPADQSGFRQNRDQDEQPRRGRSRNDTIDEIAAPVEAASARRLVRLGGVDLSI